MKSSSASNSTYAELKRLIDLKIFDQTLQPFFCVFTVVMYKTSNHMVPAMRHTPLQTCTPMKSVRPSFFLSKAPAMGAPMRVAILETDHDMPNLVPRRDKSGVIFAKAAEGTVTSAAEKKPTMCQST